MISALGNPIPLSEALSLLDKNSLALQLSRLSEKKTQQESIILFTKLFPLLQVEASSMYFGDPLEVNLLGEGAENVDCSSFDAFGMGDLCASFSKPMVLREAQIFDAKAQIVYPISALYSIFHGYQATKEQHQIAQLETENLRRQLRVSFIRIYAQALYLRMTMSFVEKLEERLGEHQKNITAMVDSGLVNAIEKQRIQIALSELQLSKQEAQDGYILLCHQLKTLIGRDIEPMDISIPETISMETFVSHTKKEILIHQERAAKSAVSSAFGQLFPTISLVGATTRTGGQGELTPIAQSFVGISFQGNFAFGAKWFRYQQSKMDWELVKKSMILEEEKLQSQVNSAVNKVQITQKKRVLAEQKVLFATENQKQTRAFYSQQLRTNAELLDAETELLEAQLYSLQTDLDYLNSIAEYEYAMGKIPMRGEDQ